MGIHEMEHLALLDSIEEQEHNLLKNNIFYYDGLNIIEDENNNPVAFVNSVREILLKNPSAVVVLDAHSGNRNNVTPPLSYRHTEYYAKQISDVIMFQEPEIPYILDRIAIRSWGHRMTYEVSRSQHSYAAKAREGKGWVEFYIRMGPVGEFELPARPEYHFGIPIPHEQEYDDLLGLGIPKEHDDDEDSEDENEMEDDLDGEGENEFVVPDALIDQMMRECDPGGQLLEAADGDVEFVKEKLREKILEYKYTGQITFED